MCVAAEVNDNWDTLVMKDFAVSIGNLHIVVNPLSCAKRNDQIISKLFIKDDQNSAV